MSRKHFKALAAAIAKIKDDADRRQTCDLIGKVCQQLNPTFKWSTWATACRCDYPNPKGE